MVLFVCLFVYLLLLLFLSPFPPPYEFCKSIRQGNSNSNQVNNQSIIPSTDVIQPTLTLRMTTAQVVQTSVTVNNNSPIQDYVHPDDQPQPTFEMTPGFKPFTVIHSHPEHPHSKPNEPKCLRYGRIGLRLCASVNQERIRGLPHRCGEVGGARTAVGGAERGYFSCSYK